MANNTREIRRRIKSVKNTAKITKAMQLVAASKMKRAQDQALAGRPYSLLFARMLAAAEGRSSGDFKHPLLEEREVKKRGILVVSTDKGLCGALVANLNRLLVREVPRGEAAYVAIGRKATQFLARTRRELLGSFTVSDQTRYSEVRPALEMLLDAFEKGEVDTVEIAYTSFVNTLTQTPVLVRLAPIHDLPSLIRRIVEGARLQGEEPGVRENVQADTREMLFEPSPEEVLGELLRLYVRRQVHQMVLEAKASEHSARMVAMKTATDNAGKLVDQLTLEYNKLRQAAITQEILEISAASLQNN